jgi:hypothetical protein
VAASPALRVVAMMWIRIAAESVPAPRRHPARVWRAARIRTEKSAARIAVIAEILVAMGLTQSVVEDKISQYLVRPRQK